MGGEEVCTRREVKTRMGRTLVREVWGGGGAGGCAEGGEAEEEERRASSASVLPLSSTSQAVAVGACASMAGVNHTSHTQSSLVDSV